ncbi:hypothetical protein PI125_g23631 [Phytophthora idaei]|nr:hypothetical protein PI125_g23631 [Phytophthora idaei]KAG3135818.1 hypothetical protein PI126_g18084 [Phytophthora idaei]
MGSADGAESGGDGEPCDDAIAVPADDVNLLSTGDLSDDYENVGSSGSEDSDSVDDDVVERREFPEEDVLLDEDAALMDDELIQSLGGTLTLYAMDKNALRHFQWGDPSSKFETDTEEYRHLSNNVATPIGELQDIADSPLLMLFYYLPKSLWVRITEETNRYKRQTVNARAKRIRARQRERHVGTPETVKQIERRLRGEPRYEVQEVMHVVGLLIARMLNPITIRFSRHWMMSDDGALPSGVFGKYVARNRCTSILRDLHFVNNDAPRARDKLWKLRPVVDVLQRCFLSGWTLPSKFSFDEGVLPATSKRNTTRMFMPDNPHRYGSKMFMVCDSESAYCHRYVFFPE